MTPRRFAVHRQLILTIAVALVAALVGGGMVAATRGSQATTTSAAAAAPTPSSDATINLADKPSSDWKPFDPSIAPAPGATTHDVTFHMQQKLLEVAPGVKQMMWTFNGQVPGPILRGHIGDLFNVTVVNDMAMPHSIDFHASQTSMTDQMKEIAPGKSLTYTFKAQYSGIFMYHCGTAPALEHIGSGMYGAVIVDPPDLTPVDHEYAIVQSELYFGPQSGAPDWNKMTADKPDAIVFNGYYNQYKYSPIIVKAGDRLRFWVIDNGPSDISSFHVVGTIFDTVYKEGNYTLQRGDAGGSQALDLMPAQGGFVELTVPETGMYAMVSHKFADANDGALGMIHAQ